MNKLNKIGLSALAGSLMAMSAHAADVSMMSVKYTAGAISVGYQVNETDFGTGTADEDATMFGVSYAISDDLSVSVNSSTIDYEATAKDDQEANSVSFSHTSGGMTIAASQIEADNVGNSTAASADKERWKISATFAF